MDSAQVSFIGRAVLYGLIGAYMLWRSYLRFKTGRDKILALALFVAGAPVAYLSIMYVLLLTGIVTRNWFTAYTVWVGIIAFSGYHFAIIRGKL